MSHFLEVWEQSRHLRGVHRAFVAGATGFSGREVVAELAKRKVHVVAHVRPDSSRLTEWQARFAEAGAEVDTTPWEVGPMTARVKDLEPTLVFGFLGTTRKRARAEDLGTAKEAYTKVDFGLTHLLYEATVLGSAGARFVYLSSAGVKQGTKNLYLRARAKMESVLETGNLDYVILRPSFISGPGRDDGRIGERVAAKMADGVLAAASLFGGKAVRARYRSMTGNDVARAAVAAALSKGCSRQTLDARQMRHFL